MNVTLKIYHLQITFRCRILLLLSSKIFLFMLLVQYLLTGRCMDLVGLYTRMLYIHFLLIHLVFLMIIQQDATGHTSTYQKNGKVWQRTGFEAMLIYKCYVKPALLCNMLVYQVEGYFCTSRLWILLFIHGLMVLLLDTGL